MNILSRSVKGILACPFRSFSIAAFIAVFTIVSMVGFYFSQIKESYETLFAEEYGVYVCIYTEDKDVSETILAPLREDKNVIGVNCRGELVAKAVKHQMGIEDIDSSFDAAETDAFSFRLSGNTDTESAPEFLFEKYKVTEGEFPEVSSNEALIEARVAERSSLGAGDILEIECNGIYGELRVSGIYDGSADVSASLSTVFCDFDILGLFDNACQYKKRYEIYADDKKNLPRIASLVEELAGNDASYTCYDSVSAASDGYYGIHSAISKTTRLLINITFVTALLILILMTYLWMRKHFYDAGIYIALGRGKASILTEFAIEIIIIAVCGIALFTFLSYVALNVFGENIVLSFAEFSRNNYAPQEIDEGILRQPVHIGTLLKSGGMVMAAVVVSMLVSGISILKYKATELFTVHE